MGVDARKIDLADEERRRDALCCFMSRCSVTKRSTPLIMLTIVGVQRNYAGGLDRGGTAGVVDEHGHWLREPVGPIHWASTETADE